MNFKSADYSQNYVLSQSDILIISVLICDFLFSLSRQFHQSMKMLQENVFVHQKAKSTTGNLLGLNNPLGNTESYQHLTGESSGGTSTWNNVTNLHQYHHNQGTDRNIGSEFLLNPIVSNNNVSLVYFFGKIDLNGFLNLY